MHTFRFHNAVWVVLLLLVACARDLVAVVNGAGISREEFEQALRIEAMKFDPIGLRDAARLTHLKEQVLDRLIRDTLVYQEATKAGVRPTETELAEVYTEYKSQYTEESFQQMLHRKGIDYAAWKMFRTQRYVIDQFAQQQSSKSATMTADAVERYYQEHHTEFVEPESVHVRQIVTETEAQAKNLRERIIKGGNFAQLAAENSLTPDGKAGGDLGYIPRGSFPTVFDDVCFRLPVGAMSDVVKSEYGYHLFKVLDHRPARVIPLTEARPRIEAQLRQERMVETFATWADTLRSKAKVVIYKEALARTTVTGSEEPGM